MCGELHFVQRVVCGVLDQPHMFMFSIPGIVYTHTDSHLHLYFKTFFSFFRLALLFSFFLLLLVVASTTYLSLFGLEMIIKGKALFFQILFFFFFFIFFFFGGTF